jgi:beta-galactosidase
LFVNNYVRGATMPGRPDTQFQILLPHAELRIPEKPVDIPPGAYFIWPFNLKLGDSTLKYATAQLFTQLTTAVGQAYFFTETEGIKSEFVLQDDPGVSIQANGAQVKKHGEKIFISDVPTGLDHGVRIRRENGPEIRLILLSRREAANVWKTDLDGSMHLLETEQDFFSDERSIVLQARGNSRCEFTLSPAIQHTLSLAGGALEVQGTGETTHYVGSVPAEHPELKVEKVRDASDVPPVKFGPALSWRPQGVAIAPNDSEFRLASTWSISMPRIVQSVSISNLFLEVAYTGDVARLSAEGHLLDDNFYNGVPWAIGLKRYMPRSGFGPIELSIVPLRRDAPIFIEERFLPRFGDKKQIVDLESVRLIPQYKFRIELVSKR